MIEVEALTKRFGAHTVLDGVSARVEICRRRGDRQVAIRDGSGDDVGGAGTGLSLEDEP